MRLLIVAILVAGVWGLSQTKAPAKRASLSKSKSSSSKKSSNKKSTSKTASKKKTVGRQTQPDADRSREIQSALKTQGYLNAEPSGKWDAATSAAFAKYQTDHGVRATGKPDARSLINLGLGPKYDNQIQPKAPPAPQSNN
jgi:FtsZ-interacting cell division protein ZipA